LPVDFATTTGSRHRPGSLTLTLIPARPLPLPTLSVRRIRRATSCAVMPLVISRARKSIFKKRVPRDRLSCRQDRPLSSIKPKKFPGDPQYLSPDASCKQLLYASANCIMRRRPGKNIQRISICGKCMQTYGREYSKTSRHCRPIQSRPKRNEFTGLSEIHYRSARNLAGQQAVM